MAQSPGSENGLLGGCERESRVKCDVEECACVSYNPCGETCSQHSSEIESNKTFAKDGFAFRNFGQEHPTGQSYNSSADSNTELYDNDELVDLLHRYHTKFSNHITAQSTVEDREGANGLFVSENCLSRGFETESRVKREVEDCADVNDNPSAETSSQHFIETQFDEVMPEVNSNSQDIKQEHLSDQSDASLDDSSSESSDNEEFADLLQRCYPKSSDAVMPQSIKDNRVTVKERSAESLIEAENESDETSSIDYSAKFQSDAAGDSGKGVGETNDGRDARAYIRCLLCNKAFTSVDQLTEHIRRRHLSEVQHRCTLCEQSFTLRSDLTQHVQRVHRSKGLVEINESSETSSVESSLIGQTDAESKSIHDVPGTSQQSDCTAQSKYACLLCKKSLSSPQALRQHIERKHGSDKQYPCGQCDKSFSVKYDLTHHVKHVHGDRNLSCDKCDFTTKYSQHLKIHISTVHLEEKPHECPQCDACFAWRSSLVQHIRSIHNNEKLFQCSFCDKRFLTRQHCDVHWRAVHCGEKPFSCDRCDFRCSVKSNLTHHQRTVHDGIKRFSCDQCEFKSSSQKELKEHWIDTHCNQKLYTCTECCKSFRQELLLKRHVDAVHRGIKPYACTECDSKFAQSGSLQKHMRAIHLNEKPYSCSVCGKCFTQSSNLNSHMKSAHTQVRTETL